MPKIQLHPTTMSDKKYQALESRLLTSEPLGNDQPLQTDEPSQCKPMHFAFKNLARKLQDSEFESINAKNLERFKEILPASEFLSELQLFGSDEDNYFNEFDQKKLEHLIKTINQEQSKVLGLIEKIYRFFSHTRKTLSSQFGEKTDGNESLD